MLCFQTNKLDDDDDDKNVQYASYLNSASAEHVIVVRDEIRERDTVCPLHIYPVKFDFDIRPLIDRKSDTTEMDTGWCLLANSPARARHLSEASGVLTMTTTRVQYNDRRTLIRNTLDRRNGHYFALFR